MKIFEVQARRGEMSVAASRSLAMMDAEREQKFKHGCTECTRVLNSKVCQAN